MFRTVRVKGRVREQMGGIAPVLTSLWLLFSGVFKLGRMNCGSTQNHEYSIAAAAAAAANTS